MKEIKILDNCYKFFLQHWIADIFVVKFSSFWFSLVLSFWGEDLQLVFIDEGRRKFTNIGLFFTLTIAILTLFSALLERYHKLRENEDTIVQIKAQRDLLRKIEDSSYNICEKKIKNQLFTIDKIISSNKPSNDIPFVYTQPCEQIQKIIEEMIECLSFLCSDANRQFNKKDMHINLMYNFPNENPNEWRFAENISPCNLEMRQIMSKKSTFSHLIKSKNRYVFFNNKRIANRNGHYIIDKYDNGDLNGSIGCFLLEFGLNSKTYIRAVLSIITYKDQIVNEKNFDGFLKDEKLIRREIILACKNMAANIDDVIEKYKNRIGVELCNYYMQFLYNKEHNNKEKDCS